MGAAEPVGLDHNHVGMLATDDARLHRVEVRPFWMDRTEVTNAAFARFVAATGYVTGAERGPTRAEFPDAPPEMLVRHRPCSHPPPGPVALDDPMQWWAWVRAPAGARGGRTFDRGAAGSPGGAGRVRRCRGGVLPLAGKRLPTEPRSGSSRRAAVSGERVYPRGDEFRPGRALDDQQLPGAFPGSWRCGGWLLPRPARSRGSRRTAMVCGDVAGNVWCGSPTGIGLTTTRRWPRRVASHAIHTDRWIRSIPTSPPSPSAYSWRLVLCTEQHCSRATLVGTRGTRPPTMSASAARDPSPGRRRPHAPPQPVNPGRRSGARPPQLVVDLADAGDALGDLPALVLPPRGSPGNRWSSASPRRTSVVTLMPPLNFSTSAALSRAWAVVSSRGLAGRARWHDHQRIDHVAGAPGLSLAAAAFAGRLRFGDCRRSRRTGPLPL